jgi:predicted adenylyl cyclase CyaB
MEKNIEVEARSFVSDAQYNNILSVLKKTATFVNEISEENVYLSGDNDLRLRRSDDNASIILKEGRIHDDYRKEHEVRFEASDFRSMENLLRLLGYNVEIRWFRKRIEYKQNDLKITKGYGKIVEIEKMVSPGEEKSAYQELENKLKSFNIKITPKEEFNKAFEYYKENWKSLIAF